MLHLHRHGGRRPQRQRQRKSAVESRGEIPDRLFPLFAPAALRPHLPRERHCSERCPGRGLLSDPEALRRMRELDCKTVRRSRQRTEGHTGLFGAGYGPRQLRRRPSDQVADAALRGQSAFQRQFGILRRFQEQERRAAHQPDLRQREMESSPRRNGRSYRSGRAGGI